MVIRPPKGKKPYVKSKLNVDQSKNQISKLLRDYGCEGVSWTENFQTGQVQLRFIVGLEGGGYTQYQITPAPFMEPHRTWSAIEGKEVIETSPNWARSMRLLYNWLKTKLESIAFGLTEVEQEFLAQRVVRDVHGQETTAGELVIAAIERGNGQLALEAPKRRDPSASVETDARVVG